MRNKAARAVVVAGAFVAASFLISPSRAFSSSGRVLDPKDPIQVSNHTSGFVDKLTINLNGDRLAWVYQDRASADIYMAQLQYLVDNSSALNVGFNPVGDSDRVRITPGAAAQSQIATDPVLNADGTVLLFKSNMNLGGTNPDISPESFLAGISEGFLSVPAAFKQLTLDPNPAITPVLTPPNPEGRLSSANTTSDGTMVVFSSRRDWVPGQNPNGIDQVFLYDKEEDKYYQLTKTQNQAKHNLHPVIDASGFTVAFLSNDNTASVYQVYVVAVPEKLISIVCEGTRQDQDGIPGNECGSDLCIGDTRCPVEVCDDTNNPPVDEDGNGFANCEDIANCGDFPACQVPNAPPALTIIDSANNPVSAVTIDEGQEVRLNIKVEDADLDMVQIRAYDDDGSLKPLSTLGAKLKLVSSSCDPASGEDCSCSANIETADCLLSGPLVASFSWTPDFMRGTNNYSFVFKANDSDTTSAESSKTVTVTVRNVNHAPTLSPKPIGDKVIKQGQAIVIPLSATDSLDKDTLTFNADVLPPGAQLVVVSSTPGSARAEIRWTTGPSDVNSMPYPITVSVSDGQSSASTQGTIKVVSNRAPVINFNGIGINVVNIKNPDGTEKAQATIVEGRAFRLELALSDPDGDIVTGSINSQMMPASSIYLAGSGVFSWLPGLNVATSDTVPAVIPVTFTATDGVAQVTKTVEIIVVNALDNDTIFLVQSGFVAVSPGGNVQLFAIVKNTGIATWQGANYALVPDSVTAGLNPPASTPLAAGESVFPGATKTFNMQFTAPTKAGLYIFRVKMNFQGQKFGTISQTINVYVQ